MTFYGIDIDPGRGRLSITFNKHMWTMDDIPPFATRCRDAAETLLRNSARYQTLIHFKECHIQSQQMFAVMDVMVKASKAEQIALVADNPLARMQSKRLVSADHIRFFKDMASSLEWLDSVARPIPSKTVAGFRQAIPNGTAAAVSIAVPIRESSARMLTPPRAARPCLTAQPAP